MSAPLIRQWMLLTMLSRHRLGCSLRQLSDELQVSTKTIRRDLELLQTTGFPIAETAGEYGRKLYRIEPNWSDPHAKLTYDEALALYLGRRLIEPFAGTLIYDAAQRAYQKIRATLNDRALRHIEKLGGAFHHTTLGSGDYSRHAEILDQLLIGIEDRLAIFITYRSQQATEPVTYDIYPYGISNHRGSLYLVGYAPRHEEVRHWKVSRIEAAEVTSVAFRRPDNFDLQQHFATSFGVYHGKGQVRVKVRFARDVARYVEEAKWHGSQQLTQAADGGLIAQFELSVTTEIKSWILSFGRHAEVLEPKELREEIASELSWLAARYAEANACFGKTSRPGIRRSKKL